MDTFADLSQGIILNGNLPKYAINLYIQSCCTNNFNINKIKKSDIINFIKFIDQYPTNILSIGLLELDIIKYIDKFGIKYNDNTFLLDICKRYGLKSMYIHYKFKLV